MWNMLNTSLPVWVEVVISFALFGVFVFAVEFWDQILVKKENKKWNHKDNS